MAAMDGCLNAMRGGHRLHCFFFYNFCFDSMGTGGRILDQYAVLSMWFGINSLCNTNRE